MKTTLIMAGLAAGLVLTAGSGIAQGHRDRPDLAAMDADNDGALSLAEMTAFAQSRAAARATAMFARIDADADGLIDATEFAAAQDRRANHRAPSADE